MKVIVYLPAADQRALEEEGHDPAKWVRDAVKAALSERGPKAEGASREDMKRAARDAAGLNPAPEVPRSESDHFKPDPKPGKKK
jgi:hypothetical protein